MAMNYSMKKIGIIQWTLKIGLSGEGVQGCSQNAEKNTHIKGRLLDQTMIPFNCVPFKWALKGKNLLPEGANSFLYEKFLIVWKITFITLSDLP